MCQYSLLPNNNQLAAINTFNTIHYEERALNFSVITLRSVIMRVYLLVLQLSCVLTVYGFSLEEQFQKLSRQKRWLTIPYGSAVGLILAFAVPLDLPNQDVLLSYNVEGNYNLPDVLKYFGPPPAYDLNDDPVLADATRSLRSVTRKNTYQMFQNRLESFGFNGRICMLKMICEMSQTALEHNGLMGQLLHILLTPSSSKTEDLPSDFIEAEEKGTQGLDCGQLYRDCSESLLDLFTTID